MKAIKIPAGIDSQITVVEVTGWESMAQAIGRGCRYIEPVNCVLTPEYALQMVVDEDGLGREQPHNQRGQMLYPFSPIVGDVLVCQVDVNTRDFIDFPDIDDALLLVGTAVE